jgi:CHAT domain-containing protein
MDLVAGIYDKMNNLKNASSNYYTQLFDYMAKTDDDTKSIFNSYKAICKSLAHQTSAAKQDSLTIFENLLQQKLETSQVKWHTKTGIVDIKKATKDDGIFLDFYSIDQQNKDKKLYAFLTSRDTTIYYEYHDFAHHLDQQLNQSNYTNNGIKNKQLYEYMISPFINQFVGKRKVYISTDGVLNQIALEVLSPTGKKSDMLTTTYDIVYVENANSLQKFANENIPHNITKFVVIGGIRYDCFTEQTSSEAPAMELASRSNELQFLEGSLTEAKALSDKLNDVKIEQTLLLGCDATKGKLMHNILQNNVTHLHISTHGFVQNATDKEAMTYSTYNNYSNLLMAKDNPSDDPQLSGAEIIHNNLSDIELVFVSACNTGKGLYKPGFGNASIANAFMRAGAKKVVATLWPIPDKITAELCDHFYTHYLKNRDANEAMRFAKSQLMQVYSPEQWAAFRVMN